MSVLWDAPMVAVLARELTRELEGARLRAVRMDAESRDMVLHFRERTLVFRLHPLHGSVALLPPSEPPDDAVGLKATLREVQCSRDERILLLQLQPSGGSSSPVGIVVELMTNQWNAVWLDVATNRIRRVLWRRENSKRALAAGETYAFPEPSDRLGIERPIGEEEWLELFAEAPEGKRRRVLLRRVAFTSSLNAAWILGGGAPSLDSADSADPAGARERWLRIRTVALGSEEPRPHVHRTPKRIVPYPLRLDGLEASAVDSLLAGLRHAMEDEGPGDGASAALIPSSLIDRLEGAVADAEGRAARLREELEGTGDPGAVRSVGDLILARFSDVPKGADRVVLTGFDGDDVAVGLDPSLSPDENARRYYREAARIERARERLPGFIAEAEVDASELRNLAEEAKAGTVDADAVRERLPASTRSRRGRETDDEPSLPYRTYRSHGGLEIRVGRGAKANDELTFHHSSPDDVWLHARQAAGAHVILRWQDSGNPPARDLAQAASLAALHSQARHSSSVPVDWTRRKHVRSPRKAPPGTVVPDRVKTVFVDPDPALERELREG